MKRAAACVGPALLVLAGCGSGPEVEEEPTAPSPDPARQATSPAAADSPRAAPDGVTVAGRVLEEGSGEPVPGAYVVVLAPGVPFERWEASAGEETGTLIRVAVRADSAGAYRLPRLERGHDYTVLIAARGFKSAAFDRGLTVEADAPAVVTMDPVELERAVW